MTAAIRRGKRGVLIVGPPGIGKTSLARVFVERSRTEFADGVIMATASWAETPDHLFERVLPHQLTLDALLVIDDISMFDEQAMVRVQDL